MDRINVIDKKERKEQKDTAAPVQPPLNYNITLQSGGFSLMTRDDGCQSYI